ncbi:MAG: flavin reductase family protein [Oscillospiraceae bacterium]|nr:flavin reductase family protein [Oscillospiraceae bacterium]MCM0707116.1 flavin reductase family protein [Faecalicatena sp. BF-R-105]MDY3218817.1 flavin reductase family protein [Candidatus Fimivivens sp.]SFJ48088.1 NADH-FMN oxidoreductase RutF, flavin reductase (DIM6/NTAB) family [Ruminococcaceae bacterium D5]GKH49131.1 flavin reductase [Eubacteriales bacterium]
MEKILVKGGFPLAPLPAALVSCGTAEQPLALTVAWTGIVNSDPFRMYISVQPVRNSHPVIAGSGEFVINLLETPMLGALDYCGTHSGRDVDKFAACGLTVLPAREVKAPLVAEAAVSIECRTCETLHLGSHDMFIADVLAVHAAPALVNENGRICFDRSKLVGYANSQYFEQGKLLGNFGCSRTLFK